nr:DUF11 domain-containing protein [Deinococcus sp. JMULE3]
MSVSKSTSTPAVWRGAKATYSVTVTNSGGASSTVRVQDTLPAGFTLSGAPVVTPAGRGSRPRTPAPRPRWT